MHHEKVVALTGNKQTAESEQAYASLGELLQIRYACPSCKFHNVVDSEENPSEGNSALTGALTYEYTARSELLWTTYEGFFLKHFVCWCETVALEYRTPSGGKK
ncbi:hypothetical protein ACLOJK_030954 [Asimina triloba]